MEVLYILFSGNELLKLAIFDEGIQLKPTKISNLKQIYSSTVTKIKVMVNSKKTLFNLTLSEFP